MTNASVERILGDFRDWLAHHPAPPAVEVAREVASAPVDLAALVRQFTALRSEVNLQTRASRTQVEQNALTLEKLSQAVAAFSTKPTEPAPTPAPLPPVDDVAATRPLLKTLLETRDALATAEKHVAKSKEPVAAPSAPPIPNLDIKLPTWTRWFDLEDKVREAVAPLQEWARAQSTPATLQPMIDSLAVGYTMSLQRLDRALEQHGLERMICVGRPFDPEIMEVVDVLKDPARTTTEVIEEVRPGYRLKGQIFRCAQVRVARP